MLKHQLNYDYTKVKNETFKNPSLTMPDMAFTAKEILIRFSKGMSLPQNRYLSYTGDEYLPEVERMDMVEIEELKAKNAEFIASQEAILNRRQQARKEAVRKEREAKKAKDGAQQTDEAQIIAD